MVYDFVGGIIVLFITLVIGVVSIISPITLAKAYTLWPRFIFRQLFLEQDLRPKVRQAIQLIEKNPDEYARVFHYQLVIIRLTGVIALVIVVLGVLTLIASLRNPTARPF